MPTVFGYARASTGEQLDTLTIQQQAVEAEYHYRFQPKGFAWGGCYTDSGVSGSTKFAQRPQSLQMCLKLQRGDVIVIGKLDRGFRNAMDFFVTFERMKQLGVGLVMLDLKLDTTTPEGEMMAGMLAVLAQWERRRLGQRMKEFQAKRKAEGRPYGNPPYGKILVGPKGDRRFAPDVAARKMGALFVKWREQGWGFEQIYFHLLRERIKWKGQEYTWGRMMAFYRGEVKLQREEAAQQPKGDSHDNPRTGPEAQAGQPPPA